MSAPMRFFKDTLDDAIGKILNQMRPLTWTKEKHALKERLVDQVFAEDYIGFTGSPMFYGLGSSGESAIVIVKPQQRGHLKAYRGRAVRLICLGPYGMNRWYAARPLDGLFVAERHPLDASLQSYYERVG